MTRAWLFRDVFLVGAFAALFFVSSGCANSGASGPSCDPACIPSVQACCGTGGSAACVDIVNNAMNCGMCGVTCGPGQTCTAGRCTGGGLDGAMPPRDGGTGGSCTPACSESYRCCGSSCVPQAAAFGSNGRTDPSFNNCNGCGITCDMERASACSRPMGAMTGATRCMCGQYDQCTAGQVCVMEMGSFVCVTTSTDPRNCGMVGRACAEGESCVAGNCVCGATGAACPGGQTCCASGCIDTSEDPMNCGGCGTVCTARGPTCSGGTCRCGTSPACRAPMAGMIFMPGDPGQLCCDDICVNNDATHCGSCTEGCAMDEGCVVGTSLMPGAGEPQVCCGDPSNPFAFCGGGFPGLGDGGLPFP